ncbi:hypothetical protein FB451DRAFT_1127892 [Mycena latifolia]|nr:hypothetical protein FB451DRAFT_1127892 [Mycena latifolia]
MLLRRQLICALAAFLVIPFLLWQLVSLNSSLPGKKSAPKTALKTTSRPTKALDTFSTPHKRRHIAVASKFPFHHDVYLSLVSTLQKALDHSPSRGAVQVYAAAPFSLGFQTIVDSLQLYRGKVKGTAALVDDINANKGDGGIDTVVLGTCETDLRDAWARDLLAAWDARDAAHKFMLVCIVHIVTSYKWQDTVRDWTQRGAIRLLAISEHVAAGFGKSFLASADSANATVRLAGYEHIPIDVYIPILDLPAAAHPNPSRVLSDAVIQGTLSTTRRDYLQLFAQLKESLAQDPKVWGYLPQAKANAPYLVDTTLPDPPFRLFIIGAGTLKIPQELQNVVSVHKELNYADFYALMSKMDICLPTFAPSGGYYDVRASSTIAMAVQCNVPILVTERIKQSYTYIADDRAVVTRPAAMREVEALRALRSGDPSYFLDRAGLGMDSPIALAAAAMMRRGWTRSKGDFQSFKQELWDANDRLVERLLRDM